MARRLIINADDFGLTRGVNRSVGELAREGALTSATLMANSLAFDEAVGIAMSTYQLGVGCHVVLTDGTPVCSPDQVPSLLGTDGTHFRKSLRDFWIAVLLGKVSPAEIEREAGAQIRRLQANGIHVTHVDTHKHTHILPGVAAPLLRTAERFGVRAIRNPFESRWSLALGHGTIEREFQVRVMKLLRKRFENLPQIRSGSVVTTSGTIGISATGRLDRAILLDLLRHLPEGTWELVCHPGYVDADLHAVTTRLRDSRQVEHQALLETFTKSSSHPFSVELIHYGMLSQTPDRSPVSAPPQEVNDRTVGS